MEREEAIGKLKGLYETRGYIRIKMDKRQIKPRSGWEVRLVAQSQEELNWIVEALTALDFRSGHPFAKRTRLVVPLYGLQQTQRFLELIKPTVKGIIPKLPGIDRYGRSINSSYQSSRKNW